MAAGYSGTPQARKLGLRPGLRVVLDSPPPGWGWSQPPAGLLAPGADGAADLIVAFFRAQADLAARLPALAPRIFPAGALWAAWPRKAAGQVSDLSDGVVRGQALALGLVDVKVAAIDDDWSGLRLVWRAVNRLARLVAGRPGGGPASPRFRRGRWSFGGRVPMLVGMARKSLVLSVVVSGGAPAADVESLVKQAIGRGWTVQVITTPSALAFFDAAAVEALTGSPVRSRHRSPGEPRSRVPDAIIVAPATFNLLNQWALGIADSYALAVLAEQTGLAIPTVVLPSVSAPLAARPQFARSVKALRAEGVSVLLGPGGTAPPGATDDAFPWHVALDEAAEMTGFGAS